MNGLIVRNPHKSKTVQVSPANQNNSTAKKSKPRGQVELITFQEALNLAKDAGRKHLMLGNAFSIALFRNIFSYNTITNSDYQRLNQVGSLTAGRE